MWRKAFNDEPGTCPQHMDMVQVRFGSAYPERPAVYKRGIGFEAKQVINGNVSGVQLFRPGDRKCSEYGVIEWTKHTGN